ncbi:leucine-rich repeat domain-containing protein [Flavobacterium zepuense]|uniref:Leucine-rich repeat domain-containing protein n=1 Tax=Flavobacterium zepuense TaxID=2593302 RepID=A0A552VA51_9FLAO|nr:leucine-rich repeat domain-containing protein [Flavobacterium zepuense]TRW27352.1 leucine-rich repeat domain-containing protein [Flavobacterium zepuense]
MKKLFSLLLLSLLFSCNNDDNITYTMSSSMELTTQAQVDAFVASNYSSVNGTLLIGSYYEETDITDLSGLEHLTDVSGELKIFGNTQLSSLEGLHNLKHAESVEIKSNSITDLKGLRSLEGVGQDGPGYLIISNNQFLKDLKGLEKITELPWLRIDNNQALESLAGLTNVTKISSLDISNCPKLTSLTGLDNVSNLQSLTIGGNTTLTSLEALKNVTSLSYLLIVENNALISLQGLHNATSIQYASIQNNPLINSLQGLHNLENAEILEIIGANGLTSLQGLEKITTIKDLTIQENTNLTSLQGLQNLLSVGLLEVHNNQALVTIEQLSTLTQIIPPSNNQVSRISISSNNALTSLNGLQNVNPFLGQLNVTYNESLQNLCAITGLTPTGTDVDVYLYNNANPVTAYTINNSNCSL